MATASENLQQAAQAPSERRVAKPATDNAKPKRVPVWGWKLPVLYSIENGARTFTELWSLLPGVRPDDLVETLRNLEAAELVERHGAPGLSSQYALSARGREVMPLLRKLLHRLVSDVWKKASADECLTLNVLFGTLGLDEAANGNGNDRVQRVKDHILWLIRTGVVGRGKRLPATRRVGEVLGVSAFFVEQAYHELVREGWLIVRRRRGTFVADSDAGDTKRKPDDGSAN